MDVNGGKDGTANNAGAKFGTGYCDAQCPSDLKFINGEANLHDWGLKQAKTPEGEVKMVGPKGKYGACCAEMDIFEANRVSAALTAHPCKIKGMQRCETGAECGDPDQDKGMPGWC